MKKIVIVIFSIVVILMSITKVYAYDVIKVNSDYYYTRINSDGTKFSDKAVSYYINSKPVYCIEPGKKLGNNYTINENYNINSENKLRILLAAHYGYLYGNNIDHRYSLATQSIIWKELTGSYPIYSTQLFGEGNILDLTFYIKDIENKINSYYKGLDLYTDQDIHIGSSISFIDKSKSLNMYTSNDVYITPNSNIFNITFDTIGSKKLSFTRKKEYNENYKVFSDGSFQALLMAGNIPELNYTLDVLVKPVELKVNVKDSETKEIINNCSINIDNNTVPCNSTYTFNEAFYHKIFLESVPDDYILNEKVITYSSYSKEKNEITIYVNPYYNDYTIYKTYDDEFPEENAIFELINDEGNLIDTYTTDSNGEFKLHLRPGNYYLNQIKGKTGYTLVKKEINSIINNKKSINNLIHLNDEKILDNNLEVNTNNDHPQPEFKIDTISESLVSTGDKLSLKCLLIVFSLLCLLTKKVIAI